MSQLNSSLSQWSRSLRSKHRSSKRKSSNLLAQMKPETESLEPRCVMAADPVISEFQASNVNTIADQDGDFSDWIEIRNPDTVQTDLAGWYLTDDSANLTKWQFPVNTKVAAGDEIVVFASSKDRKVSGQELHTNFGLSADGEFLALVKPDGRTIVQSFNPYPAQAPGQSYGSSITRNVFPLINPSAPAKAFIPTSDALGTTWTQVDFNDASWTAGTLGAGYEVLEQGTKQTEEFAAPLGATWTTSIPAGSTGTVNVADGNLNIVVPAGNDIPAGARGTAPIVYRALPNQWNEDFEIVTQVTQTSADRGAAGLAVINPATGLPVVQLEYNGRANFRLLADGTQKAVLASASRSSYFLRIVRDGRAGTWSGFYKLTEGANWSSIGTVTDGVDLQQFDSPQVGMYARTGSANTMTAAFASFTVEIPNERPTYGPETGLNLASMRNQNASVYIRVPFTYNGTAQLDELDLAAMFDDGFKAYLNGVELVDDKVPIQTAWNSTASGEYGAVNGNIPVNIYHAPTKLSALRQGANVLAIHGMNVAANDDDFFFDATLLATDVQTAGTNVFFATPTPNAPNLKPAAPAPKIMSQQGTFFGSTQLILSIDNNNPNLEIRYTTDGSDPTPNSTLYTGPVTLTKSAMLQARTFDNTQQQFFEPSATTAGTFVAVADALKERTSDIPLMIIDTLGQALQSNASNALTISNVILYDISEATGRSKIAGSPIDYFGRGGVRDRGSSTGGQAKPNMTFETFGTEGNTKDDDENVSLLGMAEASDWVLHAPFTFDRNMMRNQLAFQLSNEMGMWASNFRVVEVYLNRNSDGVVAENDYFGVYVLMDKIEEGPNRVDIADIERTDNTEPNISGGYIWKVDREDPDAPGFTAGGQGLQWVYPKSPSSRTAREDQKATTEQQAWVVKYFGDFQKTLTNPDINDPNGYSKYIDPVSWADSHMLNVLMMNVDALRLSAYLYKDRNDRVKYGPVWDFDRSAESDDDRDDNPNVWRSRNGDLGTDFFGNGTQRWWGDLFKDSGFWQLYVDRWQMWRQSILSDENIGRIVDGMADELRESQVRNAQKWAATRPRSSSGYRGEVLDGTFQGEVENMKKWLRERAAFMDSNFAQPAQILAGGALLKDYQGGAVVPANTPITVKSSPLPFNVDTTLVSGNNGAATGRYFVPQNDDLGTSWTARNFNDASWTSGKLGIGFEPETQTSFDDLITTTVNVPAINAEATTILVRIPFEVTDLAAAQANSLILRAKYDDGYVAYINGTEVRRSNIRDANLSWTSRANTRQNTQSVVYEDVDLTEFRNLLVQGTNVLSIRAINSSATSGDMLILAELVSRKVQFGENPNAKVYYTTDGTDPRGPNGQPSATAKLAVAGQPSFNLTTNTRVIARVFDETDRGPESAIVRTDWSMPIQYDLMIGTPDLVISEVNYNPSNPTAAQAAAGLTSDDFEYIEIYNRGTTAANLIGTKLTDGVEFDFYNASIKTIAPGGYVLVVNNKAAFEQRYGAGLPIAGEYSGSLNDQGGEDVDLQLSSGASLFTVSYSDSDPWPVMADGDGASLELIAPTTVPANQQNKWYSWRSSAELNGSPGKAGKGRAGIVINEVLARTEGATQLTDSIELYNTTGAPINISGWFLSDTNNDYFKYEIPAGTIVPANGYVVFRAAQFNAPNDPEGFALGATGDNVYLTRGVKATGVVTEFIDDVHFGPTLNVETLGRSPNGSGRLAPLSTNTTIGSANSAPKVGPVVISEISYNPVANAAALNAYPLIDPADLEFVEIYNSSASQVDISGWHLRGGSDYDIPAGTILGPNQAVVVVKFNPADPERINRVNAFRAQYGINASVKLIGGYTGQLNNSDDQVRLLRPDSTLDPQNPPYVQVDEVVYDDLAPWPAGADGTGQTLQRLANAFGNAGASWFAASGTPGTFATSVPGDFDNNKVVDVADINLLYAQLRLANPDVKYDLTGDGKVDEADRDAMIFNAAGTTYGDSNFDRKFDSGDFVFVFQRGEYEDTTAGNSTWEDGDWNGDGDFTSADLIKAFQTGGYEAAAAGPAAVSASDLSLAATALVEDRSTNSSAPAATIVLTPAAPAATAPVAAVDLSLASLFVDDDSDDDTDEVEDELLDDLVGGLI